MRRLSKIFFIFLLPFLSSCVVSTWNQFHGNQMNDGFRPVRSLNAVQPKWKLALASYTSASPVMGKDGTIYLGLSNGTLLAVNPDGTVKWQFMGLDFPDLLKEFITSSPAISDDGFIYMISSFRLQRGTDVEVLSALSKITPEGARDWVRVFELGYFSDAAPKVFSAGAITYIVVRVQPGPKDKEGKWLEVWDQSGKMLAAHSRPITCSEIHGVGPDWWNDFLEFFEDFPWVFDVSALKEIVPLPTPAISSYEPFQKTPLIIAATDCGLRAFTWDGQSLTTKWNYRLSNPARPSSPVIFPGNTVVLGWENGQVDFLDAITGQPIKSFHADGPVVSTPAGAFGVTIYVNTIKTLYELSPQGNVLNKRSFKDAVITDSPAVTASWLYLPLSNSLVTFSLDLNTLYYAPGFASHSPSPAVGQDGTIYIVSNGQYPYLYAFPGKSR